MVIYVIFKEIGPHKTIYGAPDNRLALYYLNEDDEGVYECVLPDGTSSMINLKVRAKKSGLNDAEFNGNSDDYNNEDPFDNIQEVNAEAGTDVKLICDIDDSELSWRRIGGVCDVLFIIALK